MKTFQGSRRGGDGRGERHRARAGRALRGRGHEGRHGRHRGRRRSRRRRRRCGGRAPTILAARVDVSRPEDVERLARETYDAFGAAHVLCNNAGVAVIGAVHEHTLADWQWVINVNLWGVIHGVRAFLPRMLAGGDEGHIVNTASMAGLTTAPFMSVYDVTKHGVVALSESMYKELQVTGAPIGVSVVCPGLIDTNIMRSSRNRPEELAEEGKAGPMAQAFGQALSDRLAGGYPPSEVAEQVVAGHPRGALLHRARAAGGEGQHRDPRRGSARAAESDAASRIARAVATVRWSIVPRAARWHCD